MTTTHDTDDGRIDADRPLAFAPKLVEQRLTDVHAAVAAAHVHGGVAA